MPRPKCCRRVGGWPRCALFKPAGVPASSLESVTLEVDELEAIRLTDLEGLYQEEAAARMRVSRQTLGRIVECARKKVAEALIQGKALHIEGGVVEMAQVRTFKCCDCEHVWSLPFGTGRPAQCPQCQSRNIHREGARGPMMAGRRGYCRRAGQGNRDTP